MNRQILRNIIFAGLFLVPFISFLVSSSFFFPFITTKAFTWRIIVEVVFFAWLLLALIEPEVRPKKSLLLYGVGAFLLIIGVANLFGFDPGRSFWSNFERMEGFVALLHLGAYFLVMGSFFQPVHWKRWWNTSLIASALMVVYCFFQLAGVISINQGGVRVDGTFGNASYLAVYMLIHVFIALWFLRQEWGNKALRYSYSLLVLAQVVVLYHTATRGAILGLIGGLIILGVLNLRNKEDKLVRRASTFLVGGVLMLVVLFALLRHSSFVENSPVLSRFSSISTEELKSGGRAFVWPMAIQGFKERPLLGWGQENFIYVFQEHYQPEMYRLEPWFDRAHNIFLDWAVAGGLLGLLSYLSLYIIALYLIWKSDQSLSHLEKSILTALILAYFFHNLFVFDHLLSYILFFSILAYLHSRNAKGLLWEKSLSVDSLNKVVMPVAVIVLVAVTYLGNFRALGSNFALIDALSGIQGGSPLQAAESFQRVYRGSWLGRSELVEQLANNFTTILNSNISPEAKNEFFAFAKERILAEAVISPNSSKYQMIAGSFLAGTGYVDESLAYLEKARMLSPGKQETYFELGSAYINKADNQGALAVFKEAYDLAPQYNEAKVTYLIGSIYAGDKLLEKRLISELSEREYFFEDRIISAYYFNSRFTETISILEARKRLDPQNSATYDEYIRQVNEKLK